MVGGITMIEAIMKVGTMPSGVYWVWGDKPITEYIVGDRIKFKSQFASDNIPNWTTGRVTQEFDSHNGIIKVARM